MLVIFTTAKIASDDFIMLSYKKYCQIFKKSVKSLTIVRNGKPYFTLDGKKADIYFSLTHSGEYIFVAISDKNVGIDLQKHDKNNMEGTAKYLFGQEMSEKQSYDRYAAGEAHVKFAEKGLLSGVKEDNNAVNYHFFNNYSLAIESEDKCVYFMEL